MKKVIYIAALVMLMFSVSASISGAEGIQRIIYLEAYEPVYSVDIDNTIWDIQIDDGDIMGFSEDGMMWFFLGDVQGAGDIGLASAAIDERINETFTDVAVTNVLEDFTVNGLEAYAYEATAKANEKDVIIFATFFQVDVDDIGILIFVMDPIAAELHLEKIMKMTTSLASYQ